VKINRLIEAHLKFEEQGLPVSFGDGYLMAHNRYFRQIRNAALKIGFRPSSAQNQAYEAFPLLHLEDLLLAKTLPYSNNFAAFKALPKLQLEALTWDDVDGNLKQNFVFHEAAHGAIRTLADRLLGPYKLESQTLPSQRKFVLRMLIEESFANTCELMAIVDLEDSVHRCFFELNSYMNNFEQRTHLKNALESIGESKVIRFLFLAYLQSNFLRSGIDDSQFRLMIQIVENTAADFSPGFSKDPKNLKTLRALAKVAFQLSERFRVQTTAFHLRLAGIQTSQQQLLDFDFLETFKEPQPMNFLVQLPGLLT